MLGDQVDDKSNIGRFWFTSNNMVERPIIASNSTEQQFSATSWQKCLVHLLKVKKNRKIFTFFANNTDSTTAGKQDLNRQQATSGMD